MTRIFIWIYIFASVFASGIFIRVPEDMSNLAIGTVLMISALVVYAKRQEIENWLTGAKKKKD